MKHILKASILLLVLAALTFGQTALVTTTLSSAVISPFPASAGTPQILIPLTATTGLTARALGAFTSWILVDKELMGVVTLANNPITVIRGQAGTAVTSHASGALVYLIPSQNAFVQGDRIPLTGQCTRTSFAYVPLVKIAGGTAQLYDCLGVTTAGQLVRTDAPGPPVVGSTVVPAATITATGTYFATTNGATTISTINVPAGWAPGMCLQIQPGGTGATDTMGNIGLTSSALVVGRIITFCWSGAKWYPSYVS
jgi:hypothetical protein